MSPSGMAILAENLPRDEDTRMPSSANATARSETLATVRDKGSERPDRDRIVLTANSGALKGRGSGTKNRIINQIARQTPAVAGHSHTGFERGRSKCLFIIHFACRNFAGSGLAKGQLAQVPISIGLRAFFFVHDILEWVKIRLLPPSIHSLSDALTHRILTKG